MSGILRGCKAPESLRDDNRHRDTQLERQEEKHEETKGSFVGQLFDRRGAH